MRDDRATSDAQLKYPLVTWTRPLTAAQRDADRSSDAPALGETLRAGFRVQPRAAKPAPDDRTAHLPLAMAGITGFWHPALPSDVPQCRVCTLPNRLGLCAGCRKLLKMHGGTFVSTLDTVALGTKREMPEGFIWAWKEHIDAGGDGWGPLPGWNFGRDGVALTLAAALSAYFEAHAGRLFADRPVVTCVPSRGPLIASLMSLARDRGWFAPEVKPTGRKSGKWFQHSTSQAQRLARAADDWVLDAMPNLSGRSVILVDDLFVTGASLVSYATALSEAGASEIRAVALLRHLPDSHRNYWDALRITRRSRRWTWTPERAAVAELAPPKQSAHGMIADHEPLCELRRHDRT